MRAVVGQQISVAGARTIAGRLVAELGEPIATATRADAAFPDRRRGRRRRPRDAPDAPRAGSGAGRTGREPSPTDRVVLDRSADRAEVRAALLGLPGIGPWTADYIALRALGDPDVFLATDLGVRQGLARLGLDLDREQRSTAPRRWRPWRSYALMHVWSTLNEENR